MCSLCGAPTESTEESPVLSLHIPPVHNIHLPFASCTHSFVDVRSYATVNSHVIADPKWDDVE